MSHRTVVWFRDPAVGLPEAAAALFLAGFTVEPAADVLTVRYRTGPAFAVRVTRGPDVARDAARKTRGTRYEARAAGCENRFEVTFADLAAVLDECTSLMDVQEALVGLTGGTSFNTWNRNFGTPAGEATGS